MDISIYTITEVIGEDNSVTGELDDIWETVESWFDRDAVAYEDENGTIDTIGDQLDELRSAINAGGYTGDLEEALALKIS